MSLSTWNWETRLLALAREAEHSAVMAVHHSHEPRLLAKAYKHCAEVTQLHSKTFYLASRLLPPAKAKAAHALYAFCRVTDDIVDEADNSAYLALNLERWRQKSKNPHPLPEDLVLVAWTDTQAKFDIPHGFAQQLIDGIACDIDVNRYQNFDDLAHYCYGVASTVGLMVMHLVGFLDRDALPYAVKLGVALQLTNILRDVAEDWEAGRLYLPLDELTEFGLTEKDIAAGCNDERWQKFMQFQIARTRQLYEEANPGLKMLKQDGRFAIGAASQLYSGILDDIEAHKYDVFSRRASLGKWQKLKRLPEIWWHAQVGYSG